MTIIFDHNILDLLHKASWCLDRHRHHKPSNTYVRSTWNLEFGCGMCCTHDIFMVIEFWTWLKPIWSIFIINMVTMIIYHQTRSSYFKSGWIYYFLSLISQIHFKWFENIPMLNVMNFNANQLILIWVPSLHGAWNNRPNTLAK